MRRKREQSGQVFKRHSSWYVRFYENRVVEGEVKRIRLAKRLGEVTTKSKNPPADIEKQARELISTVNRPHLIPENVVKLGDFVERVYFPRIEPHMRPSTMKGY